MPHEMESRAEVTAWPEDVVAAFAAGVEDILVLDRPPHDEIVSAVRTGRVHEYRYPFTAVDAAARVAGGLAALAIESDSLAADIAALARSFLAQFGLAEARLRIEMAKTQSCPKFHCDNVHVRLVTTYFGPATEYQFAGEDAIQVAPLYSLVFLKGHKHPTHRDAVYHRSPEVPAGGKRLCVVIDY